MNIIALREQIDAIDAKLLALFEERMEVSAAIGAYKKENKKAIFDPAREKEKLEQIRSMSKAELADYAEELFTDLMRLSREYQQETMGRKPVCGLLGEKLSHSYSPQIHGMLGNYEYRLFEKEEEEIEAFLREGKFTGINVTIPYKRTVIPYLDEISETARRMNSVNTIVRRDGRLYGDNTDAYGFLALVKHSGIDVSGKKTLVLGSGGGSSAVCAALSQLGAESVVISRNGENHYGNLDRHRDAKIIVNTTPLGMYPKNGAAALDLSRFPELEAVYDIIYNPARTALLLQAENLGIPAFNGLYMLVAQAKKASELFMNTEIDDDVISEIEKKLARKMQNIILIGMPGCGKSTLAELYAKLQGRLYIDSDQTFVEMNGMKAGAYIETHGEEAFREAEEKVIETIGKRSGAVIATGGGVVTREANYERLHQNGIIIWVKRDLKKLPTEGRPLSAGNLAALYGKREALYARFADVTVENNGDLSETITAILENLNGRN